MKCLIFATDGARGRRNIRIPLPWRIWFAYESRKERVLYVSMRSRLCKKGEEGRSKEYEDEKCEAELGDVHIDRYT